MGHDIVTIGRHTLNTSDIHSLASELGQRMQANIMFGYPDDYSYYSDITVKPTYASIALGTIETPGAAATYDLQQYNYQLQQYYKEHGDKLFEEQFFKENGSMVQSVKQELAEINFELHLNNKEGSYAYIYKDTVDIIFFYYNRWGSICKLFTTENNFDTDFKGFNTFRKNLQSAINKFGSDEMVYLDDQGETGQFIYGDYTWQQIQEELATKFAGQVLNISAFMKDKKPRKAGDYPLAFYDDFSDLKK